MSTQTPPATTADKNKGPIKTEAQIKDEARKHVTLHVENTILEFVKKLEHPKGVAKYFPHQELAAILMQGYEIKVIVPAAEEEKEPAKK